jgi:hypothetical protein
VAGFSKPFLRKRKLLYWANKSQLQRLETTADLNRWDMYKSIGYITRLKYVLIAMALIIIGFLIMLTFFLMFTIPFALAVWAWAGIFVYLAAVGRSYSDFVSSLRWQRRR